jgi:hypothetical protein
MKRISQYQDQIMLSPFGLWAVKQKLGETSMLGKAIFSRMGMNPDDVPEDAVLLVHVGESIVPMPIIGREVLILSSSRMIISLCMN